MLYSMSDANFYKNAILLLVGSLAIYLILLVTIKYRRARSISNSKQTELRLWKRFQETHYDVIPILDDIEKKQMVTAFCNTIRNAETPQSRSSSKLRLLSSERKTPRSKNTAKTVRFDPQMFTLKDQH